MKFIVLAIFCATQPQTMLVQAPKPPFCMPIYYHTTRREALEENFGLKKPVSENFFEDIDGTWPMSSQREECTLL